MRSFRHLGFISFSCFCSAHCQFRITKKKIASPCASPNTCTSQKNYIWTFWACVVFHCSNVPKRKKVIRVDLPELSLHWTFASRQQLLSWKGLDRSFCENPVFSTVKNTSMEVAWFAPIVAHSNTTFFCTVIWTKSFLPHNAAPSQNLLTKYEQNWALFSLKKCCPQNLVHDAFCTLRVFQRIATAQITKNVVVCLVPQTRIFRQQLSISTHKIRTIQHENINREQQFDVLSTRAFRPRPRALAAWVWIVIRTLLCETETHTQRSVRNAFATTPDAKILWQSGCLAWPENSVIWTEQHQCMKTHSEHLTMTPACVLQWDHYWIPRPLPPSCLFELFAENSSHRIPCDDAELHVTPHQAWENSSMELSWFAPVT